MFVFKNFAKGKKITCRTGSSAEQHKKIPPVKQAGLRI